MKKNLVYTILLIAFASVIGVIIFSYRAKKENSESISYTLLKRTGSLANSEEWNATGTRAAVLMNAIQKDPADIKSLNSLAEIFIQEARITGNYTYYDKAALKYVNDVLKNDSLNFEALLLKAVIYVSQHHFGEGLIIAQKAINVNPYNSYIYGVLTDANVEMGNYKDAIASTQMMVDTRPDIRSYSRVSYLREIYGDYPGAITAMESAVDAGLPGNEATEWTRIQLGHLYENTGDIEKAKNQYNIALQERKDYAYAYAGLARISVSGKDYVKAIEYYTKANTQINDYAFQEGLAEAYELSGNKEKGDLLYKQAIEGMTKDANSGNDDDNIGHYVDKELAYAYLKIKEYDKAMQHALLEYNRRPENIDVNECVAWVYYSKGDYAKALPYIKTALKTNSKNPTLLCRAGLIYAKNGNSSTAKVQLKDALNSKAVISEDLRDECLKVYSAI